MDENPWIEFIQDNGPSWVWYRVTRYDSNGDRVLDESDISFDDQWITARLSSLEEGQPQSYFYLLGVDVNTHPCSNQSPFSGEILFTYNREAAAEYAIAHAYRNSVPEIESGRAYPGEPRRVTNRLGLEGNPIELADGIGIPYEDDVPYAQFRYQAYLGETGATGSAMFPSEAIWMGGMPMTYNNDQNGNIDTESRCLDESSSNYNLAGWRFCDDESLSDRGGETGIWRGHVGLVAYYSTPDYSANNSVIDHHGQLVALFRIITPETPSRINSDFGQFASFNQLSVEGALSLDTRQQEFYNLFIDPYNATDATIQGISNVGRGDYVYIERGSDNILGHGFLVVGWGEVLSCPTALSMVWIYEEHSSNPYGRIYPTFPNEAGQTAVPVIPYVVDFPGMVDPAPNYNSQLQRPRPRPFYCARYQNPGAFAGIYDGFAFFTFPNYVTIQSQQLYTSPLWEWD